MKITKQQLKQIIKEEMETLVEARDLSVYLEPLFQEGAPGNVFAEAMANNLMLDKEGDFQEMVQAIKDGLNNWYSSREQGYDQGGEDLRDEEDRDWYGDESPYDAGY